MKSMQVDPTEHNDVAELVRKLMACNIEMQELIDPIAIEVARAAPIFKARYNKLCAMGALNETRDELFERYEARTQNYQERNDAPVGLPNAWAIKRTNIEDDDSHAIWRHFECCQDLTVCGPPMAAEVVSNIMYRVPSHNRWRYTSSSSTIAGTSRAWQESNNAWMQMYDSNILTLPPFSRGASEWCVKVLSLWSNSNEGPLAENMTSLVKQYNEAVAYFGVTLTNEQILNILRREAKYELEDAFIHETSFEGGLEGAIFALTPTIKGALQYYQAGTWNIETQPDEYSVVREAVLADIAKRKSVNSSSEVEVFATHVKGWLQGSPSQRDEQMHVDDTAP